MVEPGDSTPDPDRSEGTGLVGRPRFEDGTLRFSFAARTSTMPDEAMLKAGWFGPHRSFCDEPAVIGGEDRYPPPLGYLAMGIGWCVLTQLARLAELRHVPLDRAEAHVEMDWWSSGSLKDGTAETGCDGVRIRFDIDSAADADVLAELVALAERGCYAENLIRNPVPITSEVHRVDRR